MVQEGGEGVEEGVGLPIGVGVGDEEADRVGVGVLIAGVAVGDEMGIQ